MTEYGLLLPFETDDPQFIRGFEMGRLWQLARTVEEPFEEVVHGINAEMVLRIAEATGRTVTSHEDGDDWLTVCFGEAV